jgi:hypothetical protein
VRLAWANAPIPHPVDRAQFEVGLVPTADCRLPTAVLSSRPMAHAHG